MPEERASYCPVVGQQARAAEIWNCNEIIFIQAVPQVVVGVAVVLPRKIERIDGICRIGGAGVGESEGQKAAVRYFVEGVTVGVIELQGEIFRLILDGQYKPTVIGAGYTLYFFDDGESRQ